MVPAMVVKANVYVSMAKVTLIVRSAYIIIILQLTLIKLIKLNNYSVSACLVCCLFKNKNYIYILHSKHVIKII